MRKCKTLEDKYNALYNFNKDYDESDQEPSEKEIEVLQWLCVNCTMINIEDVGNCEISCLSFRLFSLCSFRMPSSLLFSKLNCFSSFYLLWTLDNPWFINTILPIHICREHNESRILRYGFSCISIPACRRCQPRQVVVKRNLEVGSNFT